VSDIGTIMTLFDSHFRAAYQAKGVSRLPVLAIHSLYKLIMPELKRYKGYDLGDLELHSAADAQTGATGDIEIKNDDGSVFEAVEIKHDIVVTVEIVRVAASKLVARSIERYYILTTAKNCVPSDDVSAEIRRIQERTGCQIIVNGVIPTMRYYLRLADNPTTIFEHYTEHLKNDTDIGFEHRERWNEIVLS
jgi:DNA (cytosine-5)-methyltransferase 1